MIVLARLTAFLALVVIAIARISGPSAADALASLVVTVTNEAHAPVAEADVTVESSTASLDMTSDSMGRAVFTNVAPDTYSIVVKAPGYRVAIRDQISVTSAASSSVSVGLVRAAPRGQPEAPRAAQPPSGAPPLIQPEPPPPAPADSVSADASPVHDSLLGLYNASNPAHIAGEPFYGRYSYVLLRDGDEAQQAKNRAFVTKLVNLFAATGSHIDFGKIKRTDNPLSYNVFFFPVHEGTAAIKVDAHSQAAATIMQAYDFDAARDLRVAYCRVSQHANRTMCTDTNVTGPLLFTFLHPLPRSLAGVTLPPAFAYDFTAVSADQFDGPLSTVQQVIEIPAGVSADKALPPPLAAHVANELEHLADALNAAVSSIKILRDKLF